MADRAAFACILVGALIASSVIPFGSGRTGSEASMSVKIMANGTSPADVDVGWLMSPNDWNPLNVVLLEDLVLCHLMFSTLFEYDEDLNQTLPSLALDYTQVVETDLSVSTHINISSNAFFRNNADPTSTAYQLTAEDVAFTIQLIKDNPGGTWDANVRDISSVSATGTYELLIITDSVDNTLIGDLAWIPIVPKYIWESLAPSQVLSAKTPSWLVGSGPFVYNSSSLGVWYKFDRAPNYHGAADFGDERSVDIDSVTYWCYSTVNGLAGALKQGDIDCACLSSNIDEFKNLEVGATVNITKYATITPGIYDAAINAIPMEFRTATYGQGNPILLDPMVRKAILMTMDKDTIVNVTMQGMGTRADSVIASGFWHKDIEGEVQYNVAAAYDLLVQNGYVDADMDGTLECGPTSLPVLEGWASEGSRLEFRLEAPNSDPLYGAIGTAWAQMADGSGIKFNFELKSEVIMINNAWYKADYDVWVWAWSWAPNFGNDPIDAMSVWDTSQIRPGGDNCQMPMGPWWYGPTNQSGSPTGMPYSALDENLSLAKSALDIGEKKARVDSMQQMIYDSHTETPPAYLIDLYGITETRYTGWGNWTQHIGRTVLSQLLWVWFGVEPVPNQLPVASFTVTPLSGDTLTLFEFNASLCSDAEDPVDILEVRWDWENDSSWNTGWSTVKLATHLFSVEGVHTVVLEVRDSVGGTNTTAVDVSVVMIPEFAGVVMPASVMLVALVILIARSRK